MSSGAHERRQWGVIAVIDGVPKFIASTPIGPRSIVLDAMTDLEPIFTMNLHEAELRSIAVKERYDQVEIVDLYKETVISLRERYDRALAQLRKGHHRRVDQNIDRKTLAALEASKVFSRRIEVVVKKRRPVIKR